MHPIQSGSFYFMAATGKSCLCGCDALTLRSRGGCASPSWRCRPPQRWWRAKTGRRTLFRRSWPCCRLAAILEKTHTAGEKHKEIKKKLYGCCRFSDIHWRSFKLSSHMLDNRRKLPPNEHQRQNTIRKGEGKLKRLDLLTTMFTLLNFISHKYFLISFARFLLLNVAVFTF